ncbi:MAG: hypothetical protein GXP25_06635 [Planctomycetes bacterium]|nr:hypothetical protein [Planctomycetota bacterium]
MLPTVDFCGLNVTRLIIGANPFGGFSHQSKERNEEMIAYHTPERIKETWARAEAAGINTMITNNETPHVVETVREYLSDGGALQWIGQISSRTTDDMLKSIDIAVEIGCKALYFHGGYVDKLYDARDEKTLRSWLDHARSYGIPAGVAGHSPEAHLWVDSLDVADFHAVCFFRCGSLHHGKGLKFRLEDFPAAAECMRKIQKPCIGYKIMASGRIDAQMAFEYAFKFIKPTDVVNVGMHRGDKDDMVEENAELVCQTLSD